MGANRIIFRCCSKCTNGGLGHDASHNMEDINQHIEWLIKPDFLTGKHHF